MKIQGRRTDYVACPYCGYQYPQQKTGTAAIAILLVLLMIFFALYMM